MRRYPGDLVARAIEAEDRPTYPGASEVFRVFGVELIEIGIRRRETPAGIELPVSGQLHPAMLRSWRVEHETDAGDRCRLAHEFVAEELVESGRAEFERSVWSPIKAKVVAQILLRLELRIVAGRAVRNHEQVAHLRRTIASGDAPAELPFAVRLVEQRELGRGVLELPVGGYQFRRCRRGISRVVGVSAVRPIQ